MVALPLLVVGCGGGEVAVSTSTVTETRTIAASSSPSRAALSVDGMYQVGVDVQPGTYKTAGPADPSNECYWRRVSNLSGDSGSTLAFNFSAGQQVVEIMSTDVGFETKNCQPWQRASN
jgi:hypothetical protein